jgi:hypothetical protein
MLLRNQKATRSHILQHCEMASGLEKVAHAVPKRPVPIAQWRDAT